MNELVSFFHQTEGIECLTPEQTVACISCFMNDEEDWKTAKRAGISIPLAEQCRKDLWNAFLFRKQKLSHAL